MVLATSDSVGSWMPVEPRRKHSRRGRSDGPARLHRQGRQRGPVLQSVRGSPKNTQGNLTKKCKNTNIQHVKHFNYTISEFY